MFDTFCFNLTTQIPPHGHLATRGRDYRHSAVPRSSLFLEQTILPSTLPETWTRPVLRAGGGGGGGGGGVCKTHHYGYRPPLLRLFQDSMSVSPYFAPKHISVTRHNSGTQNARVSTCPSSYQYLNDTLTLRSLTLYIYGAPILDVSRSHTTTQHSR